MEAVRSKVLVLAGLSTTNGHVVDALREMYDITETSSIDQAIDALRSDHFDAIFSDSADFLPLERALVSQQASLILNTIGEGVCIVDGEARCAWMNKKMQAWPPHVHEKIRRTCQEAFDLFSKQVSLPQQQTDASGQPRSKRYVLNIDDQQFLEMMASPVISPSGAVVQIVAVVWDATSTRRLQQKIDTIDRAGRELLRLETEAVCQMGVADRLKMLEEKIVSFTRQLMHFDHFAIRLVERKTNKLELVIGVGLPADALDVQLYARADGNGISGYVADTGRSYICNDVEQDPRYVMGLDSAKSSLTVPLRLNDKVIGIFNIESRQRAAFTEDDRQFAEIFGRYIAIALNILDLMVGERVGVAHKVTDDVCTAAAGPLNDIAVCAEALKNDYIGNEDLTAKLQQIVDNVAAIRAGLQQAAQGPSTIIGADKVVEQVDPVFAGRNILVADDDATIRTTIRDILRKFKVNVTVAPNGTEAVEHLMAKDYDLVISDIMMPDKTGYEIFAAARKKPTPPPVVLMTGFGYDPKHSIVRASQEGLQAVLFKPFKVDALLAEVRKALTARASR